MKIEPVTAYEIELSDEDRVVLLKAIDLLEHINEAIENLPKHYAKADDDTLELLREYDNAFDDLVNHINY